MQSAEVSQRDPKIEIPPHTSKAIYEEVKTSEQGKRQGGKKQNSFVAENNNDFLSRSVHRSLDDVSLFINRRRADEEDEELYLVEGCCKTFSQRLAFVKESEETSQIQNDNDLKIVSDFNQIQQQQQQHSNPSGSSPSYFKGSGGEEDTKLDYSKTNSGQLELQQEEDDEVIEPTKQLNILSFIQTQLKQESIIVELPKVDVERRANVRDYLQRKKESLVGRKPATSVNGRGNQGQSGGIIEENQWKIFAKMRKVRKFCRILLDRRFFAKYTNMSRLNVEAINDYSGFFDDASTTTRSKSNTVITKIQQTLEKTFEGVEVVMPQSYLELTWNILMFVVLLQQFLLIPIEICFDLKLTDSLYMFFLTFFLPAVILSFDMLAHFNLAYYHNGKLITDRAQIFQNYISTTFPVNLLTVITFLLQNKVYFIQLVLLLRIPQLPRLLGKIDDHFQLQQRYNTPFELSKLLMLVFGCAHFVACGFHFVATRVELLGEDTWIQDQNLQTSSKDMRYLQSIYYAIITMVTVGYGDITPISWQEKIYVIVVTILSCGMFGYSMNTIGAIFQEIAKREANFKQVKYDMGQYMRSRDIPKFLQTKVLKNLEYSNILNGDQVQKGEAIMNTLTMTLRNQIKREFYGRILSTYKLFNLNFSLDVRLEICLHMKEIIFQPGEILFDSGQINDRIYFLHKGSVEMIQLNQSKQSTSLIGLAQSGSMLGQYGFFTNQPEILQARCQDTCYLLYCDRANFQLVLSKYEYDREVFCKLRDNLLVYNRQFDTTCFSCSKIGHETSQCPFYSMYQIGAPMCIYRHLRSTPQPRDGSHIRRSRRSQNTLWDRWHLMVEARRIRLNYFYLAFEGAQAAILEDEELELEANDMDFLLFVPKVRYKDDRVEYSEGEISNFSESQYVQERQELARYSNQLSFSPETHRQLQLARKSFQPQGESAQVPLVGNGALQRIKTTCSKRLEPLSVYSECSEDSEDSGSSKKSSSELSNLPSEAINQNKEKVINLPNLQNHLSNKSLPAPPHKPTSYGSLSSSKNSSFLRKKSCSSPISRFSMSSSQNGQGFMEQSSQLNNLPTALAKTKKASVFAQHQQQILAKPRDTLFHLDGDFSASEIPSIPEISPLPTNQTNNDLKRNHSPYKSLSIQLQKEKLMKEKPPQIPQTNQKITLNQLGQLSSGQQQNKQIQKSLPELTEVPHLNNIRRSVQALTSQSECIQPRSKRESTLLSRVSIGSLKRDSQEQILFSTQLTKHQQTPANKQSPHQTAFKSEDPKQKLLLSPRQFSSLACMENFMTINNFDVSKNFKGYYPSNNMSRVLSAWRARYMKLFFKKNKTRSSRVKNRLSRNLDKEKRPCSIILNTRVNLPS